MVKKRENHGRRQIKNKKIEQLIYPPSHTIITVSPPYSCKQDPLADPLILILLWGLATCCKQSPPSGPFWADPFGQTLLFLFFRVYLQVGLLADSQYKKAPGSAQKMGGPADLQDLVKSSIVSAQNDVKYVYKNGLLYFGKFLFFFGKFLSILAKIF